MDEFITIGSIVEVIGSLEHQAGGIDLKGAKGIVRLYYEGETEEETDEMLVEWTANTLKSFPEEYFTAVFDQEASWAAYVLPSNLVKRTDEICDETELAWTKHDIFMRIFQHEFGREGRLVSKVFSGNPDRKAMHPLNYWFNYLKTGLNWPIPCETCYPYEEGDGPLHEGDKVLLKGLNGIDNVLGILAEVQTSERKEIVVPLQDLNATEQLSKNARILNAYGIWQICVA